MKTFWLFLILCAGGFAARAGETNGVGGAPAVPASYQLAPMDKVAITISEDPVAGRTLELAVSPLGDLTVPVSRCCEEAVTLNVKGKASAQVERELRDALQADYYEKATVQVKVIDPNRRKGQVLLRGAVRGNIVQLDSGKSKTLWEALTEVGTTEFADLRKVKVDRLDPATHANRITWHDIDAVNKGDRKKDLELQDGDRVTVREKFFNWR